MKTITGKLIRLEPLKELHIEPYLNQFSSLVRFLLDANIQSERQYLQQRILKQKENKTFFYCVFDKVTNYIIGAIEIRDPKEHKGQLYCWMHESFWGTGQFQEAINLAAQEYFAVSKADTFNALVDVTNQRSYHALKKAGFSDAGLVDGPRGKQYELLLRKDRLN